MLPTKNRVYATDNTDSNIHDLARLVNLTTKFMGKGMSLEQAVSAKQTIAAYLVTHSVGGYCAGMVCDWASSYARTGNPELPLDMTSARTMQGNMQTTVMKRVALDKPEPTATARTKMYRNVGLSQKMLVSSQLPEAKPEYEKIAAQISGWVSIMDDQVLQLSLDMGDGRHAIGLLLKNASFYILEPNQGLYKFGGEAVYRQNITSYLNENCPPQSPWSLLAIVAA
jgi:hypothetical protein